MTTGQTIPANDGKDGAYVYGGIVNVNEIHLTYGEWLNGNTNDVNIILQKSIQKMTQWQTTSWLRRPNIMIVAMHPSWINKWICWGALTSEPRNKRFINSNSTGSFNKAISYGNVQIYLLRHPSTRDFAATPLNTQITSNTFNVGSYHNFEDNFRNGQYLFTSSSTEKSFGSVVIEPCYAFNNNGRNQKAWFSNGTAPSAFPQYNIGFSNEYTQAPYDDAGNYQGGGGCGNKWTTIGVGKASHPGEWLQIQFPYALQLKRYKLITNARRYVLFGSNNGKMWTNLGEKTTTGPLNDMNQEHLVYTRERFTHFRFVFKEIHKSMPVPTGTSFSAFKDIRGIGVFQCSLIGSHGQSSGQKEHFQNRGAVYEGLDNIYSQETKLLSDLTDFNQKYTAYIDCSMSNCLTYSQKKSDMEKAYNLVINTDIPNVNSAMPSGGLTPAQYDASFASLVATHDNVLKLRNELDIKMKELNHEERTKYADFKGNFDSAIYSNILVTVLATTILYFTFTKL
jgi:hypothetical protein